MNARAFYEESRIYDSGKDIKLVVVIPIVLAVALKKSNTPVEFLNIYTCNKIVTDRCLHDFKNDIFYKKTKVMQVSKLLVVVQAGVAASGSPIINILDNFHRQSVL